MLKLPVNNESDVNHLTNEIQLSVFEVGKFRYGELIVLDHLEQFTASS